MRTTWGVLSVLLLCAAPLAVKAHFGCATNSGGYTITIARHGGAGGAVIIPANINGLTVSSIGQFAFAKSVLSAPTIGSGVTNLGNGAVGCCISLTDVFPGRRRSASSPG